MKFFALKISKPELIGTVNLIKNNESNIEINQLNQLKDEIEIGNFVFVQLGGDIVPWDKGLIGLAKIEKQPYDEGYDNSRNFKIQISMCIVLDEVIKREDFRYYYDAYDAGGIGPTTKGEQNQAIKTVTEKQAVAILRVMAEKNPMIEKNIREVMGKEISDKVFGKMARLFERIIGYNEYLNLTINKNNTSNQDELIKRFKQYLENEESDKTISDPYPLVLKRDTVISEIKEKLPEFKYDSFYQITDEKKIKEIVEYIKDNLKSFNHYDIKNYTLTSALIKYQNFIESLSGYCNIIFYGVPGVGKSFRIKQSKLVFWQEKTVFHPEYTNADFVGQLLPVKNKREDNTSNNIDNKQSSISYEFVPGPFTRILAKALKDPEGKYMLVIDEINRGNAAAIFGEIFQLLDRDESGESEFSISNKDIYDYLIEKEGVDKSLLPDEKIYLPSNLYIWATMNTSDQNVYTLDTAFQRRWQMEMLTIDFDKDEDTKAQGEIPITNSNNKLTWREFVTAINAEISNRNEGMISVEDKRIGPWFAKKNEIEDKNLFTQKVIKYLWDDAFKMSRPDVFKDIKNLDDIVDKINKGGTIEDIFYEKIFEKVINDRKKSLQNGQETNDENEIEDTNE